MAVYLGYSPADLERGEEIREEKESEKMKRLLLILGLLMLTAVGWCGINPLVCSTITISCSLCGGTTNFDLRPDYYTYRIVPENWVVKDMGYFHWDCWNKFRKFLIELYRAKDSYDYYISTGTQEGAFHKLEYTDYPFLEHSKYCPIFTKKQIDKMLPKFIGTIYKVEKEPK